MKGSDVVATQEFRDVLPGVSPDASDEMAGYDDDGMADGFDDVGASDEELDSSAASGEFDDDGEQDPLVTEVLSQWRPKIEAEIKAELQQQFDQLRSTKDAEVRARDLSLKQATAHTELLSAQLGQVMGFLKQKLTPENGFDPREFTDLENQMYRTRDTVTTSRAERERLLTDLTQSAETNFQTYSHQYAKDPETGQQVFDPKLLMEHPKIAAKKAEAMDLAARFAGSGGVQNTPQHMAAYRAFQELRLLQEQVAGELRQQAKTAGTRQTTKKVREDQKARGTQVTASRSGGTGKMTEERVWEVALKRYPDNRARAHQEYLKLLDQYKL